jgi:hypothetical protein
MLENQKDGHADFCGLNVGARGTPGIRGGIPIPGITGDIGLPFSPGRNSAGISRPSIGGCPLDLKTLGLAEHRHVRARWNSSWMRFYSRGFLKRRIIAEIALIERSAPPRFF